MPEVYEGTDSCERLLGAHSDFVWERFVRPLKGRSIADVQGRGGRKVVVEALAVCAVCRERAATSRVVVSIAVRRGSGWDARADKTSYGYEVCTQCSADTLKEARDRVAKI